MNAVRIAVLALLCGVFCPPAGWGGIKKTSDPKIDELIAALKGSDTVQKLKAAVALTDLGPAAEPAIPHLVALFEDKSEDLRLNAALALSKIGAPSVKAVEKALDHKDADVRFYAVWSLGWIGPPAKGTAPLVVKLLADPSENVRRKAAFALGKIAPEPEVAVRALIAAFGDKNAEVRQAASDAVGQFKEHALPALRESLATKDPVMRIQVLKALEGIGPEAKVVIPEVQAIFLIGDKATAEAAAETLAKIGKEAIGAFKEGLKSDRPEIRLAAVRGLGKIGAPAAPDLVDALAHDAVEVRRTAADVLGPMRVSDRLVVLGLAHCLEDKDGPFVVSCLRALQQLGPLAKEAVPKMLAALDKHDAATQNSFFITLQNVRGEAKDVLPVIEKIAARKDLPKQTIFNILRLIPGYGSDALPLILTFVKNEDATVRTQASFALANVPGDLSKLLEELEELAKDANAGVRRNAMQALGRAGEKALKPLQKALGDADFSVRSAAAQALGGLGAAAKPALEDLAKLVSDANVGVRRSAVMALGRIGPDALDHLTKIITDGKDQQTQIAAIQAVGGMADKAKGAVDALIQGLKATAPVVRSNAALALGNIGPDAKLAIPTLEALAMSDVNIAVRNNAKMALARIKK